MQERLDAVHTCSILRFPYLRFVDSLGEGCTISSNVLLNLGSSEERKEAAEFKICSMVAYQSTSACLYESTGLCFLRLCTGAQR